MSLAKKFDITLDSILAIDSLVVEYHQMQRFFRLFFAGALICFNFRMFHLFLKADFHISEYVWPAAWLGQFDANLAQTLVIAMSALLAGCFSFLIFRPQVFWLRFFAAILFFVLFAVKMSLDTHNHSMNTWSYCCLILCWCRFDERKETEKYNGKIFWCAGALFLSTFFLAGFDKVLNYFEVVYGGQGFFETAANYLPIQLSVEFMTRGYQTKVGTWLSQASVFTFTAFAGTVLIECGALFPIIKFKYYRLWAVLIILFHSVIFLAMDIRFIESSILCGILLLGTPLREMDPHQ